MAWRRCGSRWPHRCYSPFPPWRGRRARTNQNTDRPAAEPLGSTPVDHGLHQRSGRLGDTRLNGKINFLHEAQFEFLFCTLLGVQDPTGSFSHLAGLLERALAIYICAAGIPAHAQTGGHRCKRLRALHRQPEHPHCYDPTNAARCRIVLHVRRELGRAALLLLSFRLTCCESAHAGRIDSNTTLGFRTACLEFCEHALKPIPGCGELYKFACHCPHCLCAKHPVHAQTTVE